MVGVEEGRGAGVHEEFESINHSVAQFSYVFVVGVEFIIHSVAELSNFFVEICYLFVVGGYSCKYLIVDVVYTCG